MPTFEKLEIRPVELDDVPALLDIVASTRGTPLTPADHALYAHFQRQRTLYFVALLDGEVVGGAGVAPLAGSPDPLTCELQRLYLRADARGLGIGDALLERCLAAAKQFLYVRCYLEAVTEMHAALEFYGRHGFRNLRAPAGRGDDERPNRWLMRELRASAAREARAT